MSICKSECEVFTDLQRWMPTCRNKCGIEKFEIKLKKFKRSMRKSIRWIICARAVDNWQRDKLIDKDKMIKRSMGKSILLNVLSSKTIARFEAKFGVTQACFFVVILSSTDLCVHWSVLVYLYGNDTIQ